MTAKFEIHITDMQTFMNCRQQWWFGSRMPRALGLEKKVAYAPFFTGRAVHYCLEQYYENRTPVLFSLSKFLEQELKQFPNLWPMEQEVINEQIELLQGTLVHYVEWAQNHQGLWSDNNLEFIALETEFHVPLRNPSGKKSNRVLLGGRFDGLVRRRDNGTFWLWEIKTAASPKRLVANLENNQQTGAYVYAAQELFGTRISGVLYTILRKKVPTTPAMLQSGFLSQNKAMDTTPQHYLQAIHEVHAEILGAMDKEQQRLWIESHYGEMLQHLLQKQEDNPFFMRMPVRRTPMEIDRVSQRIWEVGLEMTRDSTSLYPNPNWSNCSFCSFRAPCLAKESGFDYQTILEVDYQPRRAWDALEGIDQDGGSDATQR